MLSQLIESKPDESRDDADGSYHERRTVPLSYAGRGAHQAVH